ncbi:MAG: lasso peptide biosynthesis B2 protein [bacterium]
MQFHVDGWPQSDATARRVRTPAAESGALLTYMEAAGLLTRDAEGRPFARHDIAVPRRRFTEWSIHGRPKVLLQHARRFGRAYISTLAQLKTKRLDVIVARYRARAVELRKTQVDIELARQSTLVFRELRPYFYSMRDQCLLDSLTLAEYLGDDGVAPTLIIGVCPRPFAAHSWLQIGRSVLNGTPENARRFTALAVV